jgi:AraC-like DNA-binding protein
VIKDNLISVKWHRYYKRDQFLNRYYRHLEWVMFIIDKGRCRYDIGGIRGEACKGDLVVLPAMQPIEQTMLEPMRFHFVAFEWLEDRGSVTESFESILRETPSLCLTISDADRFHSTSEYLRRVAAAGPHIDRSYSSHYVNDLWLLGRTEQRGKQLSQRLYADSLMEKARERIAEKAFDGVSLKDIAAEHYLSSVQFTRRFHTAFGVSPMDYMSGLRLEKACTLLEETEYTIEHVANLCGYESRSYFCRLFNERMKLTPSQYRRIHRV